MKQDLEILVALPLTGRQEQTLRQAAPSAHFSFCLPDQASGEQVERAQVIIGKVSPEMCAKARNLQWYQGNAAGPDAYLKPGALPESVTITTASGAYGLAVSEHMLAMTLAVMKRLHTYRDSQRQHAWSSQGCVTSMRGARVLVIGLGDIGGSYARRCAALEARVTGVRRRVSEKPDCLDALCPMEQLDELLPGADIVAMFLPGGDATYHVMDARRIALMKRGSILVNGGRGSTLDADALLAALREGRLFGAALDVTDPEPLPPEHPLWDEPAAFITPHISGLFHLPETVERIVEIAAENLRRYLADEPLNQVARHGSKS